MVRPKNRSRLDSDEARTNTNLFQSISSTYKPSPLSFGSPRTSPFRRPESPASPSTTIRPSTPTKPTTTPTIPQTSPSKLQNATTPTSNDTFWTPRGLPPSLVPRDREAPPSPTRTSSAATAIATKPPSTTGRLQPNSDALSRLPVSQVREMREGFQILDRDNDGLVTRDDVLDMLTNLGQPSAASDATPFFPPGAPQTLPLPTYLSTLSSLLAPLSPQAELLSALAAFDDHDSGEIDVAELRDALVHTAPEAGGRGLSAREVDEVLGGFAGRRAFGKGSAGLGGRGEVFRYREWVGGFMGVGEAEGKKEGEK